MRTLSATDTPLNMRIESNSVDAISRYQAVVTRHLKPVASQETVEVQWAQA